MHSSRVRLRSDTMDLPPEWIIKEADCLLGVEVGRGPFGVVCVEAVLKQAELEQQLSTASGKSVPACAKVRRALALCRMRVSGCSVYLKCVFFKFASCLFGLTCLRRFSIRWKALRCTALPPLTALMLLQHWHA